MVFQVFLLFMLYRSTHMPQRLFEDQRTTWKTWFSPSTFSGTRTEFSGLASGSFTCCAMISSVLQIQMKKITLLLVLSFGSLEQKQPSCRNTCSNIKLQKDPQTQRQTPFVLSLVDTSFEVLDFTFKLGLLAKFWKYKTH